MAVLAGWGIARSVRSLRYAGASELRSLVIEEPGAYWAAHGFVPMVAPLRAPTNQDESDQIVVWLKLPEGGIIRTRRPAIGSTSLIMPPGTLVDRVESLGGTVVDVRGTRFDEKGEEHFHVLRPARASPESLEGYEWRRHDREGEKAATEQLLQLVKATEGPRAAHAFAGFMDCTGCHFADRPQSLRVRTDGLPNRATDGSGLFQMLSVLSDDAPLEFNRPRDLNVDDPRVRLRCADEREPNVVRAASGDIRAVCADGSVPRGRFALREALRFGDPRAAAICRARAYLEAHLDDAGRRDQSAALDECRTDGT